MNHFKLLSILLSILLAFSLTSCELSQETKNTSAKNEQSRVEKNQQRLNSAQPAPEVQWSLERDNLIKRFELMNDRSVIMYMYIFNYGISKPIGYYQVNKVSSVNSQLTNPLQIVSVDADGYDRAGLDEFNQLVLDSPAEDGSYGTNGDAIFGFTPDEIYIEHNMQYICSTVPLRFQGVDNIANVNVKSSKDMGKLLDKIKSK